MTDGTADTQELWPQLLQVVKERMRFAWILLSQNASVFFYDGTTLTLNMFSPGAWDTLINSDCRNVLEEVLAEFLNPPPAVELLVQGRTPSPPDLPSPEGPTQDHSGGPADHRTAEGDRSAASTSCTAAGYANACLGRRIYPFPRPGGEPSRAPPCAAHGIGAAIAL
ncbi:hypothetical protein [Streptomyces sp. B21-083]|uniref:hypothetical protein n=1 Tax=Streptomyces sp. B21-083 TaxID=3039410 RepID=UPI002FF1A0D8